MSRIENWSLVVDRGDKILYGVAAHSLHDDKRLSGIVFGHSRLPDGVQILSTIIKGKKSGNIVTASGSEYELGAVSEDHEKYFPNQKERLFRFLPEIANEQIKTII